MRKILITLLFSVVSLFSTSIVWGQTNITQESILIFGDSLSAEYGLKRGQGWVALLEQKLKETKYEFQIINASVSGETTSGGKTRIERLLKKYRPKIVVIELGGNDALRGLALKASEENLRTMIRLCKEHRSKVLLVGMRIPPNYGKSYSDDFYSMYGKIAKEEKIQLLPFLLEGIADNVNYFQADRIHPTANAHPIILENVWSVLKSMLK